MDIIMELQSHSIKDFFALIVDFLSIIKMITFAFFKIN